MIVSSVNTDASKTLYSKNGASQQSQASDAPLHASETSQSSTQVTLSPEAQSLATLASKGITNTQGSLAGLDLPPLASLQGDTASIVDYFRKIKEVIVSPPTDGQGKPDGVIDQTAFEGVVKQFGGTQDQADQLFAALKKDDSDSLSHTDILGALASTLTNSTSATAQSLLALMGKDGSGVVSQSEFTAFETTLIAAESPSPNGNLR